MRVTQRVEAEAASSSTSFYINTYDLDALSASQLAIADIGTIDKALLRAETP